MQVCFADNFQDETRAELFDVCLQALAQIWLVYPEALEKTLADRDIVFELIRQAVEPPKPQSPELIKP